MKGITYKHTLSGGWDDVKVTDKNLAPIGYGAATVSFINDITIRGADGEEEILITKDMSPMEFEGFTDNGFPFQVKGTGDLFVITMN